LNKSEDILETQGEMTQAFTVFKRYGMAKVRGRIALVAALAIIYLLVYPLLHRWAGDIALAVALVPAGLAGWFFGMRAGVLAGLAALTANLFLFLAYPDESDLIQFVIGSGLILGIAALTGHARDSNEGWQRELIARDQTKLELERRNRELTVLSSIALSLADTIRTEEVLETALARVLDSLRLDKGGIYLLTEDSSRLELAFQVGISEDSAQAMKVFPFGDGITGGVAKSGTARAFTDIVSAAGDIVGPTLKSEKIVSAIFVPLRSKGKTLGVLIAAASVTREFTSGEISLLEAIAGQIGIAIENARLFQRMAQLSLTDELTELHNRRHFNQIVESEMLRSKRDWRPFSLVLIDLDSFKVHNDRYGHQSGDGVLRAFARALQTAPRKTDTAFRLGGDEFSIILPSTSSEVAWNVVERVRSAWQAMKLPGLEEMENPVSFSAGVSEFPRDGDDAETLIAIADETMYESKSSKKAASGGTPGR